MLESTDNAAPDDGAARVLGKVEAWRADEFERAGLDPLRAGFAAVARDSVAQGYAIDVESFRALTRKGATPDQAYEILRPL